MSDFVIAILIVFNLLALALAWYACAREWQEWNDWVLEMRKKYPKDEE